MLKKALIGVGILIFGIVAFYGTHIYLSRQRIAKSLAANPEYQRIIREEDAVNEAAGNST